MTKREIIFLNKNTSRIVGNKILKLGLRDDTACTEGARTITKERDRETDRKRGRYMQIGRGDRGRETHMQTGRVSERQI